MRTQLSKTTLSIGPDDSLKVQDVYEIEGGPANTSVKDVLVGLKDEAVDTLRKTPRLAQQLTKLVVDAKSGRLDAVTAAKRIGSIFGNRGGVLDQLSTRATNMISSSLGMDPKLAKRVLMTVKDVGLGKDPTTGFSRNMGSASGIVSSIQRLLGDKDVLSYVDLEAEAALLSGLLGEAVKAGIPQSVDLLLREAKSDAVRREVAARNMYAVVFSGSLVTVEKLTNYLPPEAIRAKYPNFARDFLAQFVLGPEDSANTYPDIKTRIVTLFNKVDPNWAKSLRNGQWVDSLAPFVRASDDAKKVFETSSGFRSAITIAADYRSVDLKSWIKKRYKYFPT